MYIMLCWCVFMYTPMMSAILSRKYCAIFHIDAVWRKIHKMEPCSWASSEELWSNRFAKLKYEHIYLTTSSRSGWVNFPRRVNYGWQCIIYIYYNFRQQATLSFERSRGDNLIHWHVYILYIIIASAICLMTGQHFSEAISEMLHNSNYPPVMLRMVLVTAVQLKGWMSDEKNSRNRQENLSEYILKDCRSVLTFCP